MDTAIIITGIIGLGAGLALGAVYWSSIITAQKDEIAAMQDRNFDLRHELGKVHTMAHTADAEAQSALEQVAAAEARVKSVLAKVDPIIGEFYDLEEAHAATKRRLSAAKGQITKLKRRLL